MCPDGLGPMVACFRWEPILKAANRDYASADMALEKHIPKEDYVP